MLRTHLQLNLLNYVNSTLHPPLNLELAIKNNAEQVG